MLAKSSIQSLPSDSRDHGQRPVSRPNKSPTFAHLLRHATVGREDHIQSPPDHHPFLLPADTSASVSSHTHPRDDPQSRAENKQKQIENQMKARRPKRRVDGDSRRRRHSPMMKHSTGMWREGIIYGWATISATDDI